MPDPVEPMGRSVTQEAAHASRARKSKHRTPSSSIALVSQSSSETAPCLHRSATPTLSVMPEERDFQDPNRALKAEVRSPSTSVDLLSESSSDSAYCFHRPMMFDSQSNLHERTIETALDEAIEVVGKDSRKKQSAINKTKKQIQELKNRQVLTENVLKNLVCSSNGKPVVTCPVVQL